MCNPSVFRVVLPAWLATAAFLFAVPASTRAAITDFTNWTLVEDPPNALFDATATATNATLGATGGPIPVGTDIGYQSVDANTPAGSATGFAFDPAFDFSVAIDYTLSFGAAAGGLGLGFGIGEDGAGVNSAGMALATLDGSPFLLFTGAARVNNVNQPFEFTSLGGALTGTLFATYETASGDIVLGASQTPGAASADAGGIATFTSLQNQWPGGDLLTSFFLRSDAIPLFDPDGWDSGTATAGFSNFRVLDGSPIDLAAVGGGDFDTDGDADLADILRWQRANGTGSGLSDWNAGFGSGSGTASVQTVPEPSCLTLLLAFALGKRLLRQAQP